MSSSFATDDLTALFSTLNVPSSPPRLLINDSSVYRVTIHKDLEGNLSTRPINGCLFCFNAQSGILTMQIVHRSVWNRQRKLGQLAKIRAVDEIEKMLEERGQDAAATAATASSTSSSTPPRPTKPSHLYIQRTSLYEHFTTRLAAPSDHPSFVGVEVKYTALLNLPFHVLFQLPYIKNLVDNATQDEIHHFQLYGTWLNEISAYTCFLRLASLLRAMEMNVNETKRILKMTDQGMIGLAQNRIREDGDDDEKMSDTPANAETSTTTAASSSSLWPSFTDEEWLHLGVSLKTLILQSYASAHEDFDIATVTQDEIRNIILQGDRQEQQQQPQDDVAQVEQGVSEVEIA